MDFILSEGMTERLRSSRAGLPQYAQIGLTTIATLNLHCCGTIAINASSANKNHTFRRICKDIDSHCPLFTLF